ncbi:hypothetical protein CY35_07G102900 [Sphagnum magellanicum]|jgi:hypothetical protein|uniref:Uncharacterized protein n=1 Tax=Sphagnum magellanicum TaxID=128215 RepID=A0ACB8HNG2_9BRYO|nr:hypothetical protein CY35_07G102900 [Sphagnum magellanicum]
MVAQSLGFDQMLKTSRTSKLMYCCIISSLVVILITTWACPESKVLLSTREHTFEELVTKPSGINDPCAGKRIYMYDLPPKFNVALLERCGKKLVKWIDFCPHMQNYGFGQMVSKSTAAPLFAKDWYGTDAYMLEVIFHARMQRYKCLTNSESEADAFFIPYFAGIDALNSLYTDNRTETLGPELVAWLQDNATAPWQRHGGHDHFLIAGRTAYDFARPLEGSFDNWGTTLLNLPELANITDLTLEGRKWLGMDQAIPYPTGFHPATAGSLRKWTDQVLTVSRRYLFAFSGALRPSMTTSIRGSLYDQCLRATTRCSLLDCSKIKCSHNPVPIYSSLLLAEFCLQPRGDTATRRSVFDSIIAGCIPVFFHEDTAYNQYSWHLPTTDPQKFSVFIPEEGIKNGSIVVEEVLGSYSKSRISEMRDELIKLIPGSLYRHPDSRDAVLTEKFRDAFDLSIDGMLKKVASFKLSNASTTVRS